jgi:hypothetical protein
MRTRIVASVVVGILGMGGLLCRALAADHADAPGVFADPSTDITDVYTWMPDATHVALVMNVFPSAAATSKFSSSAKYVFHTAGFASLGGTQDPEVDVICTFDTAATQNVSCWVGALQYVSGNASNTAGLASADGKVKVFTGLRDDPFFFNLGGFRDMASDMTADLQSATLDAAGCPNNLPAVVRSAVIADLSHTVHGTMPPADTYAGANVLSIVLQVDKSLLLSGGHSLLSVWGSTNQ